MDWRREGEVMERILALLVSFAGLADRAAFAPACLALPVLAFLARAEAVARTFVVDLPAGAPALLAAPQATDRAARLAAAFRALARLLRALLARARRRACFATGETDRPDGAPITQPRLALAGHAVPALPAPDTS